MFRRNHRVLCLSAPLIPDPLVGQLRWRGAVERRR
jgi:hypothetical protein